MAHRDWGVAFVAPGTAYDSAVHGTRRDAPVEKVTLVEREPDGRARLALTIGRSGGTLYDPGAARWCFLSRELADGSVVLVAQGYVLPLPLGDGDDDATTLEVNCSPYDYAAGEAAILSALQDLPLYDGVLVAPEARGDKVEVLDGAFSAIHCHRATHAFSRVDLFGVGLPVVTIDTCFSPGPSKAQVGDPLSGVFLELTAEWVERRAGKLDLTDAIRDAFPATDGLIPTLSGEAFANTWWKAGDSFNGDSGYTVVEASLVEWTGDVGPTGVALSRSYGPVTAPGAVYNYVRDPDLTTPLGVELSLEATLWQPTLAFSWYLEQKRVEVASGYLPSGHQGRQAGNNAVLRLRCQDLQRSATGAPWEAGTVYATGDLVTVGWRAYEAASDHAAGDVFGADLAAGRWSEVASNGSPLGSPAATTYFRTARGVATINAALFKARALIADSIRCVEIVFRCPVLDAYLGLTTGSSVRLVTPTDLLPGGEVTAKVYAYELHSSQDDEYLEITLRAAIGSGTAVDVAGAEQWLTENAQAWDYIRWAREAGSPPISLPPTGSPRSVTTFSNLADVQLAYVQARDYDPDAGRTDPDATDPDVLLREARTTVEIALTQVAGVPDLRHVVPLLVDPYQGPRQFDTGL
ncbi:hypothetical protein [Salinarimonas rosea]|uniref:hypothetical protein n=1 Tax=Salinarimonas rosea TaxID=552063 RepID=UPI000406A8C3|nr:hypothetical protein [Salinarimonas rosea]